MFAGGRTVMLVVLMLLTACATCAILFPTFRMPKTQMSGGTTKTTIYYWYLETALVSSTSTTLTRTYTRDLTCKNERTYMTASAALAVGGAGLGGLACLFMACWVNAGYRVALGVMSCLLTFFAFACCVVVVALTSYLYVNDVCSTSTTFKSANYKMVEGFILMAVAAGGFMILFIAQVFMLCCTFCGTNYDDLSSNDSRSKESRGRDANRSNYSSRRNSYH